MRNSQEIIFILLLTGLQWTENNAATDTISTIAIVLTSSTSSPSTHTTEWTVTTGITQSVISPTHSAERTTPSTIVDKSTQSSSTTPSLTAISLLKTTHQSTLSTIDGSHSSTSNSRMSPTSAVSSTVSSDLSTVSKSYGTTPSVKSLETASVTASYDVNSTTMASTNETETAVPPTQILPKVSTTPLTQKNTTTVTNIKISSQTPSPHSSFTDSAESREPQKGRHHNGGVVFGAIVGAVLGCALISLVGYFLCGKRKSDSFGHQRLYDDTRNDPVLRLDNAPEPYGANFGDLSYYNPPTANKTAAHDAIPMDDMTPS